MDVVAVRLGRWALAALIGVLVLSPLIRLQALALDDGARGYSVVLDRDDVGSILLTTVFLALGSLVIALVLGISLAWMSLRLSRRTQWLAVVPILPIIAPAVATVTGWAVLLSPGPGYLNAALRRLPFFDGNTGPINIYSTFWIVVVTGLGLTSFVYVFVRSGLANVHAELIEASQVAGASPLRAFTRIVLPVLRPAILYGGTTALLLGLGQFTAPLLLGTRENVSVLTTEMYRYTAESPVDFGAAAALGSPLLIVGIVIVLGQRYVLGDRNRFVTHGGRAVRFQSQPSRLSAVGIALFGIVSLVLPIGALVAVAFSPFWMPSIDFGALTLANFRTIYEDPSVRDAILNSITFSIAAIALVIPLGFVLATVINSPKTPRIVASTLDTLVALPLGVPAAVIGAGFLFAVTGPPLQLYGSRWAIILVYVTLMLPFSTRIQLSGRAALGQTYEEAAAVSGASPLRAKLQIVLPLMRTSIAGAAALIFIILSHEFSASLLVRSVNTQVMGTKLYEFYNYAGGYPTMAAMALTMFMVTIIGVFIAFWIGGRGALDKL